RRDLLGRGDLAERERLGRVPQPGQVLIQPEDPAAVQPQALPDRVAALDGRIERADPGLVPVAELAVHADDQIPVAVIKGLQHRQLPGSKSGTYAAAGNTAGSGPRAARGGRAAARPAAGNRRSRWSRARWRTSTAPTRRRCPAVPAART